MAPLPSNNTDRVFYDYVTGNEGSSQEHTVAWRFNGNVISAEDVDPLFLNFLDAVGESNFRSGWRVVRARVQLAGNNFSVPYAPSAGLLAFVGIATSPTYEQHFEAIEDTFQGRSPTSGRRVDFSLYRAAGPIDPTFRQGMSGAVQSAIATALTGGALRAIDFEVPVFYTYINQNYNSYWERELRS